MFCLAPLNLKLLLRVLPLSVNGIKMAYSNFSCVNLSSLKDSEKKGFLDSFDTVLTDCDGVVWLEGKALPGAVEAMNTFKEIGKKVFYVTNNSTLTRAEFVDKCRRLGFNATEENIISTAWLSALYLKNIGFTKKVYVVGSKAIAKELKTVGIECFGVGPDTMNPEKVQKQSSIVEDIAETDNDVGAVIVGYDHHFSLPKMVKACTYLDDPNCIFIGTNTDQRFPHSGKFVWPGTGSFIAAIETAAERKSIIMGKPAPFIIDAVLKDSGMDPKRTLMIGDRCNTDIQFGTSSGMITLLVLTGVTKLSEVEEFKATGQDHLVPTFYSGSIADLLPFLKKDLV